MKRTRAWFLALALICTLLCGCEQTAFFVTSSEPAASITYTLEDIPDYSGEPYVEVNGNVPYFTEEEETTEAFETYSPLDALGRCGVAYANVCIELMPTEERGSIGQVKPSGWHTVKYDCVDGKYLYNRCHLIGYQLAGENANEQNLITGTRYLNVVGMLPFEDEVANYVQETDNHVLYRVTPIFEGDNLVASGLLMEAKSVEDAGEGVQFCVYVYNVQPGVTIDYATGESWLDEDAPAESAAVTEPDGPDETAAMAETAVPETSAPEETAANAGALVPEDTDAPDETAASAVEEEHYVLNTSSMKFHLSTCSGVAAMSDANRQDYYGDRETLLEEGYSPCGICKP